MFRVGELREQLEEQERMKLRAWKNFGPEDRKTDKNCSWQSQMNRYPYILNHCRHHPEHRVVMGFTTPVIPVSSRLKTLTSLHPNIEASIIRDHDHVYWPNRLTMTLTISYLLTISTIYWPRLLTMLLTMCPPGAAHQPPRPVLRVSPVQPLELGPGGGQQLARVPHQRSGQVSLVTLSVCNSKHTLSDRRSLKHFVLLYLLFSVNQVHAVGPARRHLARHRRDLHQASAGWKVSDQ